MVHSILRAHHDNMSHCGLDKTVYGVKQQYWFSNLRKRIADYIENCFTCIMSNSSSNRFEGKTQMYPSPNGLVETVHIDHFSPLQEIALKYKHILVVVDAFTRFTWLCATKSTNAKETIIHLKSIFYAFGNPKEIISDRGTDFTVKRFSDFLDDAQIKHRKVAVAAPWANGWSNGSIDSIKVL